MELNCFSVVNYSFLDDWLSVYFFGRSLNNFVDNFFTVLSGSGLYWHVVDLSLSSVELYLNIFGQNSRLDIFFFDGGFTGDVDRYSSGGGLTINNWLQVFGFGVYRSLNNSLSNDGSLNDSLFDDWLLYDSLSDERLRDDLSGDYWFGVEFLGLSNNWLAVKNFSLSNCSGNSSSHGGSGGGLASCICLSGGSNISSHISLSGRRTSRHVLSGRSIGT